jgi:hypothetical protein
LAYKEGRHWAGYKASLEDLAIVCCWRGSDEEEPDWFAKLNEDAKEKIDKKTDAWSTVEELAIDLLSEDVRIRSDEDGFDFYWENHEAAQEFISGAQNIWWMIEDEAIGLLTSSKRKQ